MLRTRVAKYLLAIKRLGFYSPFTLYFLLFGVAALMGYRWLRHLAAIPDSSYKDILNLLLSLALVLGLLVLSLGGLSVGLSFVFFKWKQAKTASTLQLSTPAGAEQGQLISISIHPILQPLLGYIRIRLQYDQGRYSEKFSLVKQGTTQLLSTKLEGIYNWKLPEIREYRIEKAIVYFEDLFQFFSFATPVACSSRFYTPPETTAVQKVSAFPRKTETQSTRIEELRKVEGEYINYKNFESNDDVRRIVWKIYAKNKELVVRIPEILDPYASHIYFYASFYSDFETLGAAPIETTFLDHYKTVCWSVYQQLVKTGIEVRYVPDQERREDNMSEGERVKFGITVSSWQRHLDLKSYVKPKDAALVLISSLSNAEDVRHLTKQYGDAISFLLVPLSGRVERFDAGALLQWLFIKQEKEKTLAYRGSWRLSPLRLQIKHNEEKLLTLLKPYEKSHVLQNV